jgi:hypothetical protein
MNEAIFAHRSLIADLEQSVDSFNIVIVN